MRMLRPVFGALALACAAWAALPAARAQSLCPGSTVRFLVPFPGSGSSADSLSRAVAARLAEMWGKNVIVENKPGAGGIASNQTIIAAAPDGCTIGLVTAAISINPSLMKKKLPYDTLKELTLIGQLVDIPVGLFAHPSLPVQTVQELVAYAKKQPQGLTYGTPGVGTGSHLAGALLASMTGIDLVHVPYKGAAPAELDLIAGRIALMFAAASSEVGAVKAGKLRLIAIAGDRRFAAFPEVPTIGDSIPGYSMGSYFGVVAPGGMARPLAQRLSQDIAKALASPEVKARLDTLQLAGVGSSPEEFEKLVRADIAAMAKLVESTGLSID